MIETRKMETLVMDFSLYPRNDVSDVIIRQLLDAVETGAKLPLMVVAKTGVIVDGFHRYKMYLRMGVEEIKVEVREYESDAELFADAVRLNRGHGRPLDSYDLKRIALRLQKFGFSKEEVSEIAKVPIAKIERVRHAETSKGEPIALKRGLRHLGGMKLTKAQQRVVEQYGGGEATFYARQLLMLLGARMEPMTVAFEDTMNDLTARWNEINQERNVT